LKVSDFQLSPPEQHTLWQTCHVCLDEAGPSSGFDLLRYNGDETKVLFIKQPVTEEELGAAQRALEICPTNAIGDDGD
jgi:ferredoxin